MNYVTVNQDKETFIEELQEQFVPLMRNHFIRKEKSTLIDFLRQRFFTEDAIISFVDFAENNSLNVQHAIQACDWNLMPLNIRPKTPPLEMRFIGVLGSSSNLDRSKQYPVQPCPLLSCEI